MAICAAVWLLLLERGLKAKRSGWRRVVFWGAIVLIAVLGLFTAIIFGFRVIGWGSVRILNQTTEPISDGAIETFGRRYSIPTIQAGSAHRIIYWFDGEGESTLVLLMKSGRLVCGRNGYIDPLLRADDLFVLRPTGLVLNEPKGIQASISCNDKIARDIANAAGWRSAIGAAKEVAP